MMRLGRFFQIAALILIAAGAQPAYSAFYQWSKTASSNATADPSINWAEGMSPSSVNDSARAMMARAAEYRDDISGALSLAGTSTAYTLTTNQGLAATPTTGQMLAFKPNVANGVAATLQTDGGNVYPLQSTAGTALPAASIVAGTPYRASFSGTAWVMEGGYANPYAIPLGGYLYTSVSTAPNSNFATANGACISRTTYAAYFAQVSTTYGACDGTTTFGIPDHQGRVPAMLDGGTGRLTNSATGCGTSFNALGVSCANGTQSFTLVMANLPAYTPTVNAASVTTVFQNIAAPAVGVTKMALAAAGGDGATSAGNTVSITMNAQGGTSTAVPRVQPTWAVNVYVRIN